jgi:hypothetical protein
VGDDNPGIHVDAEQSAAPVANEIAAGDPFVDTEPLPGEPTAGEPQN